MARSRLLLWQAMVGHTRLATPVVVSCPWLEDPLLRPNSAPRSCSGDNWSLEWAVLVARHARGPALATGGPAIATGCSRWLEPPARLAPTTVVTWWRAVTAGLYMSLPPFDGPMLAQA